MPASYLYRCGQCLCVCVHACVRACVPVHASLCACMPVFMCIYVSLCTCVYACMCTCLFLCSTRKQCIIICLCCAQGPFVAAFAQSNEGDVSPNTKGPHCLDSGIPCDILHSTCHGKVKGGAHGE